MRKSFGGAIPAPTHPSGAPPPYTPPASGGSGVIGKRPPPPIPTNKPKPHKAPIPQPVYVLALYDFKAQAEGDLSFKAGAQIEIVKRSEDAQDWWTGRLNGAEGAFPGKFYDLLFFHFSSSLPPFAVIMDSGFFDLFWRSGLLTFALGNYVQDM